MIHHPESGGIFGANHNRTAKTRQVRTLAKLMISLPNFSYAAPDSQTPSANSPSARPRATFCSRSNMLRDRRRPFAGAWIETSSPQPWLRCLMAAPSQLRGSKCYSTTVSGAGVNNPLMWEGEPGRVGLRAQSTATPISPTSPGLAFVGHYSSNGSWAAFGSNRGKVGGILVRV